MIMSVEQQCHCQTLGKGIPGYNREKMDVPCHSMCCTHRKISLLGALSTKHRSEFGGPAPSPTMVMSPCGYNMIERDQKQQAIANKQNKFPVYVLRICFPLIFAITTEQLCSFVCLSFSYRCIFIRICFLVHRVPNAG